MGHTGTGAVEVRSALKAIGCLALAGVTACSAVESIGKSASWQSPQAAALHERCGGGDTAACGTLGNLYLHGRGVPEDLGLAESYLTMACENGHADACADLGDLRLQAGEGNSAHRAVELFEAACRRGSLKGCARLGRSLVFGSGLRADVARGLRLLAEACEAGEPEACLNMGGYYLRTAGGKKHHTQAARWFEKAVQRGGGHGTLALLYWKGLGFERNPVRARELFAEGCRLEDPEACVNLGIMCQLGEGGPTDHAAAVASFRRACTLGSRRGCGQDAR